MVAEMLALPALSAQLTAAIDSVESQRVILESVIERLASEAVQLHSVSTVLTEAAHTQGSVLLSLQQSLNDGTASPHLVAALADASRRIGGASDALEGGCNGDARDSATQRSDTSHSVAQRSNSWQSDATCPISEDGSIGQMSGSVGQLSPLNSARRRVMAPAPTPPIGSEPSLDCPERMC